VYEADGTGPVKSPTVTIVRDQQWYADVKQIAVLSKKPQTQCLGDDFDGKGRCRSPNMTNRGTSFQMVAQFSTDRFTAKDAPTPERRKRREQGTMHAS